MTETKVTGPVPSKSLQSRERGRYGNNMCQTVCTNYGSARSNQEEDIWMTAINSHNWGSRKAVNEGSVNGIETCRGGISSKNAWRWENLASVGLHWKAEAWLSREDVTGGGGRSRCVGGYSWGCQQDFLLVQQRAREHPSHSRAGTLHYRHLDLVDSA